jgi:hypothetical protein
MLQHFSRWIAMADAVVVKRTLAKQVHDRVKSELCLVCDGHAERRGLCMRHYQAFLSRQKEKGAHEKQISFEEDCIREGKILPVYEMQKIKREDPFAGVGQ